ncbi:MAG: glycosyltransferase [Lachnospiraceae bacterium]|nr:glycosyltransferase [Lachnospiraceae bacterium]
MKILMIIPSLFGGGAENIACELLKGFPKEWQIDVLVRKSSDDIIFSDNVHILRAIPKAGAFFAYLKNAKRNGKYDYYISHMAFSNFMNMLSGKRSGKRILTIHSLTSIQMKSEKVGFLYNHVIRFIYRKADRIVTVGIAAANDMINYYRMPANKVVVIANGIDVEQAIKNANCPLTEEEEKYCTGEPIVCAVGRYNIAKRFDYLIKAMSIVKEKYQNCKLLLVGEGEERVNYEKLIEDLQLKDNVVLCGWNKTPQRIMLHSNCVVSCSDYEGFNLSMAEAMVCGVPCIFTNHPGGTEELLLSNKKSKSNQMLETGILCPNIVDEAGIEMLSEAIVYIYEHPNYAFESAEYNRERKDELSIRRMIEKWVSLLTDME